MDPYTPIPGKCMWWRETWVDEDRYDLSVKAADKRVRCTCFVEGLVWTHPFGEVPRQCPESAHCRYHIVAG